MKIKVIFQYILLFICFSCSKVVEPKNDINAIYRQFHGKYRIISSYSDVPVDANLDGKESVNLKDEITDFYNSTTEIRIYERGNGKPNSFLFLQFWQEQYISGGENKIGIFPQTYDSSMYVNFAGQGGVKEFEFNADLTKLIVSPYISINENADAKERFKSPESVTYEGNEKLKIVTNKWLFTRKGWINVTITSIYERYTMIT